jgi:hypothetical protein
MKLMPKHRRQRHKVPRIAFSEAEITADLLYPAGPRPQALPVARRGRRR